jgi:hypothetical protein
MIKLEKTVLPSAEQWEAVIRGIRNPKNSWARSDSVYCEDTACNECPVQDGCPEPWDFMDGFVIGPNDIDLMTKLSKAGTDHRKFMRMIAVYVDITAPLYWWKEFDTYKVGTVANSCSTMHKIHERPLTIEDFSCDKLMCVPDDGNMDMIPTLNLCTFSEEENLYTPKGVIECIVIPMFNKCREYYLKTNNKEYWYSMIQLLPSSYNQKRTVMMNYEVLANIYRSRKTHKLDEWKELCKWIEGLPYSELITGEDEDVQE